MSEEVVTQAVVTPVVNTADGVEGVSNPSPPLPPKDDGTPPSPPSTVATESIKTDDARWDWNTKVLWRQKWRVLSYEKKGAQSNTI